MKKEQVLLVWEENPESVQFYLFDVGSHEAILAKVSNNLMINGDDIDDEHPIFELQELLPEFGSVRVEDLRDLNIVSVYKAGFFL